jgi:EAL domain-containing protein (putative c-di-GMP-specific phosphodiesterase class I)
VIGNHLNAAAIMNDLHGLGVRISLDDFGTGYSSLAYLDTMPIDELKIDRSFVGVDPSKTRRRVLSNIVSLGLAFGQTVTAEGVEDHETLDFLAAAGCHCAQGFAISEPLPPERFEKWLTGR